VNRLRIVRLAALLLLAGCLDKTPFDSTGPDDAGVAVSPATLFLEPGASYRVGAFLGELGGGAVQWASSDPAVARVESDGTITARRARTGPDPGH
jgi:hypothetical protein